MDSDSSPSAETALAQRLRQQELIAGFGLYALRERALQPVLDEACRLAAEGLGCRFAKVLRFDPAAQDFLMCAGVGWEAGLVGRARLGADLASPAGYAFRTGHPVVSNHLSTEDRFRTPRIMTEHGVTRAINVLIGGGKAEQGVTRAINVPIGGGDPAPAFGVLEVDSGDCADFEPRDVAFLQSLANVVAAAVLAAERQSALDALLRQKDLLMQEVHHRVRNSLQLVHTLLQLQINRMDDAPAREHLTEAARRVLTVAAVHKQLYAGDSVREADLISYLSGLVEELAASLAGGEGRAVVLDAAPAMLSSACLTSVGLVVAELVTNALKYGDGRVTVSARAGADAVRIAVADEGPGFPAGFDPSRSRGLGMRLVTTMAHGAGAIRVDRDGPGARIVVDVPIT